MRWKVSWIIFSLLPQTYPPSPFTTVRCAQESDLCIASMGSPALLLSLLWRPRQEIRRQEERDVGVSVPLSLCGVAHGLAMSLDCRSVSSPLHRAPSPSASNSHLCSRSAPRLDLFLSPDHTFVKHPFVKFSINYPICVGHFFPAGT